MGHRIEHAMMCYAALAQVADKHDTCVAFFRKHMNVGRDIAYLAAQAEARDVAGPLYEQVRALSGGGEELARALRPAVEREIAVTAKMAALRDRIERLFRRAGIEYIPLKGADPRLVEGARGFYNPMTDLDVLVRLSDRDDAGCVLEENGFHFQGVLSGSHVTFFSEDEPPDYVELHWDLINRDNPLHASVFKAAIDDIWERRIVCDGSALLSPGDLLGYSLAHGLKEYFHKPKWLADCFWILSGDVIDYFGREAQDIIREWGVAGIRDLVVQYLEQNGFREADTGSGVCKPGFIRRVLASHLDDYSRLKSIRPLLFMASSPKIRDSIPIAWRSITRAVKRSRPV